MNIKPTINFTKQRVYIIASFLLMITMVIAFSLVYTHKTSKASTSRLNLSEKQLLLLNNYLYLTVGPNKGAIIDNLNSLKTNNSYDKKLVSAPASGIKDSEIITMLKEIENDPILSDLVIVEMVDTDIRAICLVPSDKINTTNAEAVIIYQGTKAIDNAWLDNLEGATQTDTELQLEAGRFHNRCEEKYTVTNISGHSKGGNLSQYVTITNGQNVRTCVSFDGQGFSDKFIAKYKNNITQYSKNIVAISSYKEPIHALLTTVAKTTLFVKTDPNIDAISSHYPSVLYNKTYFDKYGMYKSNVLTEETVTATNINKLVDGVVANVDSKTLQYISEKAAPIIATFTPIMQDSVANEEVSSIEALYSEITESIKKSDSSLTDSDVEVISDFIVTESLYGNATAY